MLAEIGQILLIIALVVSLLQAASGLVGAHVRDGRLMAFADRSALLQAGFCTAAFALLMVLFARSDFTVELVAKHSHTLKPMLYKLSGTWGNHEGSMLLWVMILALFGGAMALFGQGLPATLRSRAIAVQGLVGAGFTAFLIFTSNPFTRLFPAPLDGRGLNPLLQDPGLAFHPPFLYLGYVGFSVAFSFAVAALIEGRVDAMWARWVRPWVLLAWSFLTIGITLGSVWAYYELGWGGWWFWDPVENVSFMPWLAGTALLHSTLVVQSRSTFINWTLLLAIATFSLSLVGTFIVRSGVLTSVHAFAVDPDRGVFILALLLLSTGGALTLYALRSHKIISGATFDPVSRESGLVMNNLLLVTSTATVFLGTFYPLIIDAISGDKITVGPPYFNITFLPIMSLLILFMAIGPLVRWRSDSLKRLQTVMIRCGIVAAIAAILTLAFGKGVLGAIGIGLAGWLAAGTITRYWETLRLKSDRSFGTILSRWRQLPGATHGFALAHIGLAISAVGITAMGVWSDETSKLLRVGDSVSNAGYTYTLDGVERRQIENYDTQMALISVRRGDELIATLDSEKRFYPVEQQDTTEVGLHVGVTRTLFAAIGDGNPERGWMMRVYYHPFVSWIWIGALMMALGGFVSLADRRFSFVTQTTKPLPADAVPAE